MSNRETNGRFKKGIRSSIPTEFKKGIHWRPYKIFRDKDYLISEYINKQRSANNIAKEHGITESAILFWLNKNKIQTRKMSEIRKIKKWGLRGRMNGMYGRCGSANPRWIDGSSPLRQTMYARSFWKELATTVYERDKYKCVRCDAKHTSKQKLHAHHIKVWAGNPNSRFDLKNIITLCQSCHKFVHSKRNIKNEYLS